MATADTAVVPASPLPLSLQGFMQLPPQQKLVGLIGAAVAVALVIGMFLWSRQPDYSVLFSNIPEKDGGAVIAALQQQNVPYKMSEGGHAIMVPANLVHDVRLRLASQGLPRGGNVGFELMENQKLGVSQFQEQITYQRALEGELARSIQSLAAVQGARVHLALPKQTGFLRDDQKPSASVLVNLYPGRELDPSQIAGIVHLVSSSVPQLVPSAISVVDQTGKLLSQQGDPLRNAGLDPTQIKYVQELEAAYIRRIEAILAPITGHGNYRAQVMADVDFNQAEQTAETYKPNQTPDNSVIRSQQTSESMQRDGGPGGIPGALSNQPPVPATAPLTQPAAGPGAPASNSQPTSTRRDSTINYEVDKTIRHVKQATGQVKRLSVAVIVNHRKEVGKDGKALAKPLSEAEMNQIQALVKEAMGYSKERGDTLNVANAPFSASERETIPETPWWKNPEVIALAKEIGRGLLFVLAAGYVFFAIVRPYLRSLRERAQIEAEQRRTQAEAHAAQAHLMAEHGGHMPLSFEQKVAHARELAKQDPKLVATVIRDWVGNNEQR